MKRGFVGFSRFVAGFSRFVIDTHKGTSYATSFVTISSAVVPVTEEEKSSSYDVGCRNDTRNDENCFIHEIIFCSRKLHRSTPSTRKTVPKVTPASRPPQCFWSCFVCSSHFLWQTSERWKRSTHRAMFARNYANLLASRKYFPFNRFVCYQTREVPVEFLEVLLGDFLQATAIE